MKEQQEKYDLPEGWVWVTIDDIGIVVSGGTPSTKNKEFWGGDISWITPADLSNYNEKYIVRGSRNITQIGLDYSSAKLISKGSILFSSRAPIGYVVIAKNDLSTSQGFKNLIPMSQIDSEYIYYYFSTLKFKAEKVASGTTFLELSAKNFSNLPLPLCTLNEQKLIVSQIELIFSKLDEAESGLKKTEKHLRIYKQALLKNAFAGKLTNKDLTADKLPIDWKIVKVSDLSNVVRGGSPRPAGDSRYYDGNIPFLKVKDITKDSKVHLTTFEYTIKEAGLIKTRQIKPKTLLLSNSGATLGIPKICLIDSTINDGIAAFLDLDERSIYYLYYFFLLNTQKLRDISMGATQPNLNTTIIKNIELPYCSFDEQRQIVAIIESRFTLVDNLQNTVENVLNEIIALKHSILKKAFEGRLVNYNSNESVENLLKDIKEEKILYLENQKELSRSKPKQKKQMEEKKSILEILKESNSPISAQELWEKSTSEGDIEQFYSEIKEIYYQIDELKSKTESLLTLKDENK